jgi:hypothetical protein
VIPVDEFRCEACAVAEVDEVAMKERREGLRFLLVGGILLALTIILGLAGWNPLETNYHRDFERAPGLLPMFAIGGVGLLGIGIGAFKYRPTLRR